MSPWQLGNRFSGFVGGVLLKFSYQVTGHLSETESRVWADKTRCRDLAPTLLAFLSTLQRWLTNEPMTDGLLHSRPTNQETLFSLRKTTFKVRVVFNPNGIVLNWCFIFASSLMPVTLPLMRCYSSWVKAPWFLKCLDFKLPVPVHLQIVFIWQQPTTTSAEKYWFLFWCQKNCLLHQMFFELI